MFMYKAIVLLGVIVTTTVCGGAASAKEVLLALPMLMSAEFSPTALTATNSLLMEGMSKGDKLVLMDGYQGNELCSVVFTSDYPDVKIENLGDAGCMIADYFKPSNASGRFNNKVRLDVVARKLLDYRTEGAEVVLLGDPVYDANGLNFSKSFPSDGHVISPSSIQLSPFSLYGISKLSGRLHWIYPRNTFEALGPEHQFGLKRFYALYAQALGVTFVTFSSDGNDIKRVAMANMPSIGVNEYEAANADLVFMHAAQLPKKMPFLDAVFTSEIVLESGNDSQTTEVSTKENYQIAFSRPCLLKSVNIIEVDGDYNGKNAIYVAVIHADGSVQRIALLQPSGNNERRVHQIEISKPFMATGMIVMPVEKAAAEKNDLRYEKLGGAWEITRVTIMRK